METSVTSENRHTPNFPGGPFWGPKQRIAALVASHLCLTFVAAALSSLLWASPEPKSIPHFILQAAGTCLFGFQTGQIVLVAAWVAFSGQRLFPRVARSLALGAWLLLLNALGETLIEGEAATRLIEEHLAHLLLQLCFPVAILFGFGVASHRRFLRSDSRPESKVWQFNTRTLLLITAELAALLALGRLVLPRNFRFDEIWPALIGNQIYEILPAAVGATILPIVFFALGRRRTRSGYLTMGSYLLISTLALSLAHASYVGSVLARDPESWPSLLGTTMIGYLWTHLSAAATILFTLWLVRRIGYDFRRRDEAPARLESGSSSNAKSSAASASA